QASIVVDQLLINGSTLLTNAGQVTTSTVLTASANPASFGQSLTFTATITPGGSSSFTPGGTVTFYDGSTPLGAPVSVPPTAGVTRATLTWSSLGVSAVHALRAVYSGDNNFVASSGTLNETVNAAATSTTVSASPNPSAFGQAVTFTANVSVPAPG